MEIYNNKGNKIQVVKPFLRWAGGKFLFIKTIINFFPSKNKINTYFEPFLGSASAFLSFQPNKAKLSDLNKELIFTFSSIKNNPKLVYKYLLEFVRNDSKTYYYKVRSDYNKQKPSIKNAARFIYLNKTCFNGIFRVNIKGEYNVPYGYKKNISILSFKEFKNISELLSNVRLISQDFKEAVIEAKENDFIYLDPPYPPINGTSYFTHYTKERFSEDDQYEVAAIAKNLNKKGCYVLITNADTEKIRNLYSDWNIYPILRPRYITCSKRKHKVGELIITNYDIKTED